MSLFPAEQLERAVSMPGGVPAQNRRSVDVARRGLQMMCQVGPLRFDLCERVRLTTGFDAADWSQDRLREYVRIGASLTGCSQEHLLGRTASVLT